MNRTGLMIALAVGTVVGLVFGLYPWLDLAIAGWFYDPTSRQFTLTKLMFSGHYEWLATARDAGMWVVAALIAPAAVALIGKAARPQAPLVVPGRAVIYLTVTLALAPGLMANGVLKDYGGRPRPIDVTNFSGTDRFVPWWDPRGACDQNCSFVSGESSGAFWAFAPASLAPAPWRPIAYGAVVIFGAAIGALRMAFGGHFFSDVAFAGVFTFLIVWCVHGLIYRWRATALSDDTVERSIERLLMPMHRMLGGSAKHGGDKSPKL
jgi:membrane-associated phospholipid phosphatase